MTTQEQKIWTAAYAVSFVAEFRAGCDLTGSWDQTAENMTAENAMAVADLAVKRLQEWFKDGNPVSEIAKDVLRKPAPRRRR